MVGEGLLTLSGTTGHALACSTVDGAGILLQRAVGNTAGTVGSLASVDLGAGGVADALDVGDGGSRDGDEAKENGGDGELHFDGRLCFGINRKVDLLEGVVK